MKMIISTTEFKSMASLMDKIKSKGGNISTDLIVQTTDNNKTQFIKTNNETTIICNTESYVEDNGKIIISMQTADIMKKLKENNLTITDDKITTDKKVITLNKIDDITINTYENIPLIYSVSQKEMLRMLEVLCAVAQDETRPILTGVYFDKNNTIALDGYRMSVRYSEEYNNEKSFIVNQFSLKILQSILDIKDNKIKVNVYYNDKDIVKFEVGDIIIIAKCLEGEFIKYKSIIPEEYRSKSIVSPIEMHNEIEFIMSADKRNAMKIVITNDNKLMLKGSQCREVYSEKLSKKMCDERQNELNGQYKENLKKWQLKQANGKNTKKPICKEAKFKKMYDLVPVSDITSKIESINKLNKVDTKEGNYEIAFNPKYMKLALEGYKDDVELQMTSSISPIVVTNDISKGLELVLPIRILK